MTYNYDHQKTLQFELVWKFCNRTIYDKQFLQLGFQRWSYVEIFESV